MKYNDGKICVAFDEVNGYTTAIYNPDDEYGFNWILENSDWGKVIGFENYRVMNAEDGIDVYSENQSLELCVNKRVKNGIYTECYCITNNNCSEYFFTKDNLGIHFPYNCTFENKTNLHNNSCITHVWCGGDGAWMYSAKPSGIKPYLVCNIVKGGIADYSISYDVSRVKVGASYRGDIVLHPGDIVVAPGESITLSFVFRFDNIAPDEGILNEFSRMKIIANKYSAFIDEAVECEFDSLDCWDDLKIVCEDKEIKYTKFGNKAKWTHSFKTPGERTIYLSVNGKLLWLKINILLPLDEIVIKRAEFITTKQQYHRSGSCLDGAYLIYDRDTDKLYYDECFQDNNACRERLSMGVVVAQALQKRYDETMMKSLIKHRRFIEREIFDKDTATVYNGVNRDDKWKRAYNYPWMAVYYLEWYLLTKEKECLEISARTMVSYYEKVRGGEQESPCIRTYEICELLQAEGLHELRERLIHHTLVHAERIIRDGSKCFSEEVKCTQFMFNGKVNILCQAYMLSGDKKYLEMAPGFIEKSNAFFARQPDYHVNMNAVRYWDLYWFGKSKTYGDTMPQWLCALSAETYDFLYKCGFESAYREYAEAVVKNNLCVYFENGFASAGYLVPYKVMQYSSVAGYENAHMRPGVASGHKYDSFANDQDWALYYAIKILGKL